jgi:hypothetical protein
MIRIIIMGEALTAVAVKFINPLLYWIPFTSWET